MADMKEMNQEPDGDTGGNRLLRRRNLIKSAQDKFEKGKITFFFYTSLYYYF